MPRKPKPVPLYKIVAEFHVTPKTYYGDKEVQAIEFQYAIRRKDDSLVFRATTHAQASEILSNLEYPEKAA